MPTNFNNWTTENMIKEQTTTISTETKARIFFSIEEMSFQDVNVRYWENYNLNFGCGLYQAFESDKQTLEIRIMEHLLVNKGRNWMNQILTHVVKNEIYTYPLKGDTVTFADGTQESITKAAYALIPKGRRLAAGK